MFLAYLWRFNSDLGISVEIWQWSWHVYGDITVIAFSPDLQLRSMNSVTSSVNGIDKHGKIMAISTRTDHRAKKKPWVNLWLMHKTYLVAPTKLCFTKRLLRQWIEMAVWFSTWDIISENQRGRNKRRDICGPQNYANLDRPHVWWHLKWSGICSLEINSSCDQ
jgi:hypothetical protein